MKTKIKKLIAKYELYMGNLEWHIQTNSDFMKPDKADHLQQRIADYREIVNDLKEIL